MRSFDEYNYVYDVKQKYDYVYISWYNDKVTLMFSLKR